MASSGEYEVAVGGTRGTLEFGSGRRREQHIRESHCVGSYITLRMWDVKVRLGEVERGCITSRLQQSEDPGREFRIAFGRNDSIKGNREGCKDRNAVKCPLNRENLRKTRRGRENGQNWESECAERTHPALDSGESCIPLVEPEPAKASSDIRNGLSGSPKAPF